LTAVRRLSIDPIAFNPGHKLVNYFFRSHIFPCTIGNHCIILDLKRDQYLFTDARRLSALGPYLHGLEQSTWTAVEGSNDPAPNVISFAEDLMALGILTTDPASGKTAHPLLLPKPAHTLRTTASKIARWPMIRFIHFWSAASAANSRLKHESIESIVRTVQRRKQSASVTSAPFDFRKARVLLAQFDALRPFFPRKYLCLFDSFALLEFLSRFDLYPTWVFAVIPEPFEAHCWLQQGDVVINDDVAEVTKFNPIMAI
jgi:hypothetical protein